jgi:hypothetical protein
MFGRKKHRRGRKKGREEEEKEKELIKKRGDWQGN